MKKYFAIIGICLIIAGVISGCGTGSTSNDVSSDNVREAYLESYLVNKYGEDDYTVEIQAIEDNEIEFYWSSSDKIHAGYDRVLDVTEIESNNGDS